MSDYNKEKKMTTKVCTKCDEEKDIDEFLIEKKTGKPRSYCKNCGRIMCKDYKAKNRDKIAVYNKKYKSVNKDDISVYNHDYNKNNRQAIQKRQTRTRRERKENDPNFKITTDLRSKLHTFVKFEGIRAKSMQDLISCNWLSFELWLTFQFDDDMTMENYGDYWTLDHVIPCCNFDLTDEENQKICFHWSNIRPIKKILNQKKTGKTIDNEIKNHARIVNLFMKSIPPEGIDDYPMLDV